MGRKRTGKGYVNLGSFREHQRVVAAAGILVKPGEVIHHIDGNKRNNELSNLQVMLIKDNIKLHRGVSGEPDSFEYVYFICPLCDKQRLIQYRCIKRHTFTGLCKACNGSLHGVHFRKGTDEGTN